jgi:hypothetical protein
VGILEATWIGQGPFPEHLGFFSGPNLAAVLGIGAAVGGGRFDQGEPGAAAAEVEA